MSDYIYELTRFNENRPYYKDRITSQTTRDGVMSAIVAAKDTNGWIESDHVYIEKENTTSSIALGSVNAFITADETLPISYDSEADPLPISSSTPIAIINKYQGLFSNPISNTTTDVQAATANADLRLMRILFKESASSTASFIIRNGTEDTDPIIVPLRSLIADQEIDISFEPQGIVAPNGLYLEIVSGELGGCVIGQLAS